MIEENIVTPDGLEIRIIDGTIFLTDKQDEYCRNFATAELISNHQDEFFGYLNKNRQTLQSLSEAAYGRYLESMGSK